MYTGNHINPRANELRVIYQVFKGHYQVLLRFPPLNEAKGQKQRTESHSILTTPTQKCVMRASQLANKISRLPGATSMPGEQPELSYIPYTECC